MRRMILPDRVLGTPADNKELPCTFHTLTIDNRRERLIYGLTLRLIKPLDR